MSVTVSWKSGFNGGKNQTFNVYYKRNDNDGNSGWTAYVTTYSDPGQNMYTSAEIQPLEEGTSFVFQVYASNAFNYTVSELSYCNTSESGMHTTPQTNLHLIV
jgi:cellulase/cellobiase CelA1